MTKPWPEPDPAASPAIPVVAGVDVPDAAAQDVRASLLRRLLRPSIVVGALSLLTVVALYWLLHPARYQCGARPRAATDRPRVHSRDGQRQPAHEYGRQPAARGHRLRRRCGSGADSGRARRLVPVLGSRAQSDHRCDPADTCAGLYSAGHRVDRDWRAIAPDHHRARRVQALRGQCARRNAGGRADLCRRGPHAGRFEMAGVHDRRDPQRDSVFHRRAAYRGFHGLSRLGGRRVDRRAFGTRLHDPERRPVLPHRRHHRRHHSHRLARRFARPDSDSGRTRDDPMERSRRRVQ